MIRISTAIFVNLSSASSVKSVWIRLFAYSGHTLCFTHCRFVFFLSSLLGFFLLQEEMWGTGEPNNSAKFNQIYITVTSLILVQNSDVFPHKKKSSACQRCRKMWSDFTTMSAAIFNVVCRSRERRLLLGVVALPVVGCSVLLLNLQTAIDTYLPNIVCELWRRVRHLLAATSRARFIETPEFLAAVNRRLGEKPDQSTSLIPCHIT